MTDGKLERFQPTIEELFPDPEHRAAYEKECGRIEFAHEVAETLRKVREESHVTQAQMAQGLGVSEDRIADIESGKPGVIATLREVLGYARVCGMNVSLEFVPPHNTAA